jgi:hypothetical protein
MPFPVPDIKFYLEDQIAPANDAVVWAPTLRGNVEQFHFDLYLALLHYRCALYAYNAVQSLPKAKIVTSDTASPDLMRRPQKRHFVRSLG